VFFVFCFGVFGCVGVLCVFVRGGGGGGGRDVSHRMEVIKESVN
jgi:hypothetical protein